MGIDIGGATIVRTAGITLNTALVFNAAGIGTANPAPGYTGWKSGGSTYYGGPWPINAARWSSGLNTATGLFTCPVAGIYAMGYSGIHRGGSGVPAGFNTYGYFGFVKNGGLAYFTHCNQAVPGTGGRAEWHSGGHSHTFQCAAGDTLALYVNTAPTSAGPDAVSQNHGLYPNEHHAVWCRLVG